jgi:transposase
MQHFLGIDVGGERHVLCLTDAKGKRLQRFSFTESSDGYARLRQALPPPPDILIGMEATGHYWRNLFATLIGWGYAVALLNPLATRRYAEADLARAKTDQVDAEALARFLREKQPAPTPLASEKVAALKELVGWRERIVTDIGAKRNALHRLLDLVFPEATTVLKDVAGPLALYVLERYPLASQLATLDPAVLAQEAYDGTRAVGLDVAAALIRHAQATVGQHQHAAYALRIRATVAEVRLALHHLEQVNQAIAELLDDDEQARMLRSIPGVGTVTAATFLSEIGDIQRFSSYRELVAFAGLAPRVHQSGKLIPGRGQMCKIGPPNLRRVLWMAAQVAIRYNPEVKEFYQRLVSRGKAKRAAIGACAAKLVRVMFALLTSGQAYQRRSLAI